MSQSEYRWAGGLFVDNFAGGGGASTGISQALGRSPDIAVNHNAEALMMHEQNHPDTKHYNESVWDIDIKAVTEGKPVLGGWFSPDCFPAGTLVQTLKGYKPIEDVKVGDWVTTHKHRWMRVTATMTGMKPVMTIRGRGHPGLQVSAEHPFYTRASKGGTESAWTKAADLTRSHYWATPVKLPFDNLIVPNVGGRGMEYSHELLWLAGYYVGNGWSRLTKTRAELVLTAHKDKAGALLAHVEQWSPPTRTGKGTNRCGYNELAWCRRETLTAGQLSTNHRGLVEWLRHEFGHLAENKQVPTWLMMRPAAERESFLRGYMEADGHFKDGLWQASSVGKKLIYGLKTLVTSLGKSASIYTVRSQNIIEGRTVNVQPAWSIRWRDEVAADHLQVWRDEGMEWGAVKEVWPAAGEPVPVYNLSVEEDESYVVEGIVVHNCTHFSVAKGGKPVKKAIRGLAWIVKKWWGQSDMAVIYMENVVEFMTWGPLIAARDKATGRVLKLVPDGTDKKGQPKFKTVVSEAGEQVPYAQQALIPDKKRAGKTFRQFIRQMREDGYTVEWTEKGMVASDYGDPTTRKRFFLIARKDGLPIVWPEPTHGNPKLLPVKAGKLQPWRTAGEHIDWSIPCPSIFERDRPLADNTLRRIAKGIQKFVIDAGDEAFLVKTNHTGAGYDQFRGQGLDEPLQTITSKLGTGVAAVSLVPTGYGERAGQETRTVDVNAPLPTIVGTGKHGVVEAKLEKLQGDALIHAAAMMKFRGESAGSSCNEPLPTITAGAGSVRPAGAPHALGVLEVELASFIGTIDHTSNKNPATGMDEPIPTVTSKARHIQVAALLKHYTGVVGQTLDKPLPTITSVDHNSLMVAHVQRDFGNSVGHSADEPLGSTTAGGGGHSSLIASSLVKLKGSSNHGQPLDVPLGTVAAQGNHFAQVEAMLIKYFGTGVAASLADPLDTITSKPRFGLVTIHSQQYQIVDIGMRMLEPHELYACQGFPAGYQHETVMGKKLPKYAQVRMVGNSVPPGLARALVQANTPRWSLERLNTEAA